MSDTAFPGYPSMLAGGITNEGDFVPFELFAGESDIVTSQGTADQTAIEQFRVVARNGAGNLVPWMGNEGATASQTITFSGLPAANDTVTINGTAITFVTGAAAAGQVTIGGTAAATATALSAYIGANEGTFGVTPSVAGAVVTLSADEGGVAGNTLTVAKSGTNIAVGGATLAGGAGGSQPIGIAAQPIPAGSTGPIFVGGVFNHLALIWPASITTLAQRKAAFDGTNVFIGKVLGVGSHITYT